MVLGGLPPRGFAERSVATQTEFIEHQRERFGALGNLAPTQPTVSEDDAVPLGYLRSDRVEGIGDVQLHEPSSFPSSMAF